VSTLGCCRRHEATPSRASCRRAVPTGAAPSPSHPAGIWPDESAAIPEEEVDKADMEQLCSRATNAPRAALANRSHYGAQRRCLRLYDTRSGTCQRAGQRRTPAHPVLPGTPEQCSWAADAVGYLLEAGRFADIYRYYSGK
jgi:hypothetical protein